MFPCLIEARMLSPPPKDLSFRKECNLQPSVNHVFVFGQFQALRLFSSWWSASRKHPFGPLFYFARSGRMVHAVITPKFAFSETLRLTTLNTCEQHAPSFQQKLAACIFDAKPHLEFLKLRGPCGVLTLCSWTSPWWSKELPFLDGLIDSICMVVMLSTDYRHHGMFSPKMDLQLNSNQPGKESPWTYFTTHGKAVPTWRIIPVSKWLVTMVSKSPKWGYSPYKWPKWLINGGY